MSAPPANQPFDLHLLIAQPAIIPAILTAGFYFECTQMPLHRSILSQLADLEANLDIDEFVPVRPFNAKEFPRGAAGGLPDNVIAVSGHSPGEIGDAIKELLALRLINGFDLGGPGDKGVQFSGLTDAGHALLDREGEVVPSLRSATAHGVVAQSTVGGGTLEPATADGVAGAHSYAQGADIAPDDLRPRVEELVAWFHERYEDPAQRTPYESREGGYQWIWGGPYDAREVLDENFPDEDAADIDAAVDEIESDGLFEWAPVPSPDDYEDDRDGLSADEYGFGAEDLANAAIETARAEPGTGYGHNGYGQGPFGGGPPPQVGTAPQSSDFTLPHYFSEFAPPHNEELRDSVGNVLTDIDDEAVTDADGNLNTVLGSVSAAASAEVVWPPPPEVPPTRPAALDFTLRGGRIALVADAARSDADPATVAVLFGIIHAAAEDLARTLKATNADGRLVVRLERVRDTADVPAPNLETVFRLGHEADVLRIYLGRADPGELDPDSAAAVEALVRYLDDCVAQYPAWRAFKRNARAVELTPDQISAAPVVAKALLAEMEAPDGLEVVDTGVPNAFKDLVATFDLISTPDDPTGVIKAGCDLLAVDLVENLGNFIKIAMSLAADVYGRRYFDGFQRKWTDLAEEDGEKTAVWLHRALKAAPVGVLGIGGGVTLWKFLAATYPAVFHPLAAVWDFIQAWAPFAGS